MTQIGSEADTRAPCLKPGRTNLLKMRAGVHFTPTNHIHSRVVSSSDNNDKVNFVRVTPWATPRTPRGATANGSEDVQANQVVIGARSATAATTTLSPVVITNTSTDTTAGTATATTTTTARATTTSTTTGSTGPGVAHKRSSAEKAMRLQAKEDLKSST